MVKVIFVGGMARSGSTLTDQLLATQPGFMGLGEVNNMIDDVRLRDHRRVSYGPTEKLPCTCGQELSECTVWGPVMKDIFEGQALDFDARFNLLVDRALSGMPPPQPTSQFWLTRVKRLIH